MTLFHHLGIVAASGGVAAAPGMVLINPTSIAYSGTSASVGANGQVTFTAVTSLSLNGVFSADFDNYVVSIRHLGSAGDNNIKARLRAAGTDASGSDYNWQYLLANSTSVSAGRFTSQTDFSIANYSSSQRSGDVVYLYGPFLSQPTAMRHVNAWGYNNATLQDDAGTHSLSTSYDGMTLLPVTNNITGALQVYGVRS